MIGELKVFAAIALSSGFMSMAGAVGILQGQVLTPTNTLVPIGVVTGLFVTAIAATVKIVRFLDGVTATLEKHDERLKKLEPGAEE